MHMCVCRGCPAGRCWGGREKVKKTKEAFVCLPHLDLLPPQDLQRNKVCGKEIRKDEGKKVAPFSFCTYETPPLASLCKPVENQIYMVRYDQE